MLIWDRNIKIIFKKEGREFILERLANNQHLYFSVEINNDTTESSNIANIIVYNLSKENLTYITENAEIEILAGYGTELNTVYKGLVEKIQGKREKPNVVYNIICSTYNDEYKRTKIDLKIPKNTTASNTIKSIVKHLDKIKIGSIDLGEDIKYKDGKTIHNNLKTIFKTIAKDTKSIFYISNGLLYFQKSNEYNRGSFTLNSDEIIDIVQNEDGYTIVSTFNAKITEGMKLKSNFKDDITDIELKGEYPVIKIKHSLSFKDKFLTTFEIINEVIKKENEKEIKIIVGGDSKKQTSIKKSSNKKTTSRNIVLSDGKNYIIK